MDPFIDFGSCSMYRIIEGKTIRINNNTRGTLSCVWILPGETKKYSLKFTYYFIVLCFLLQIK